MQVEGWFDYNHAALPSTPPHKTPNLTPVQNGDVWRMDGRPLLARWTTDFDCGRETGWWYTILDRPFDIAALKSKRRNEINKGLKNFDVRRVDPRDYAEDFYRVTAAAFAVYPAEYRPPAGAIAPELAADFRQLVLHGVAFASRPHELLMSQPDRFSPAWWRKRIAGLRPLCTRFRHHIPPGHRGQVFRCYLKDCGIKLKYFWRFLSGSKDPVLRQYLNRQKRSADYLSRH